MLPTLALNPKAELVFLDIEASDKNSKIDVNFVKQINEEANMPFSIGGGIKTIEQIREIISSSSYMSMITTSTSNFLFKMIISNLIVFYFN